jgi:hypothetical protein
MEGTNVYGIGQKNSSESVNEYNSNMKLGKNEVGTAVVGLNRPPDSLLRPNLFNEELASKQFNQINHDIYQGTRKATPKNYREPEAPVKFGAAVAGLGALGVIVWLARKIYKK